jgi:uncharacterized damage-inducible protein DinB
MPNARRAALVVTLLVFASVPAGAQDPAAPPPAPEPAAAAAAAPLTDAERQSFVDTLERGRAETDALLARAEGELFAKAPAPGRGSVGQVLEHMTTTEELLMGMIETALASPADPEAAGLLEQMPVAAFGERVQDRSQPAQAPEAVLPKGGLTRQEAISRYQARREKTIEFVRTTQGALGAHTAPVPSGKLTALHFLAIVANHNLRHNKQIAEALEQLAAPATQPAPAVEPAPTPAPTPAQRR